MNNSKDIKLHNMRSILIFLIVFTGAIYSYDFNNSVLVSNIAKIVNAISIPIFCIISGYYSRSKQNSNQLIRLFGLFMSMNLIFFIYEYISLGYVTNTIIKYSSWYLVDFVIWKLLYKQIKNKPMAFIINIILILLLSIIPNNFNYLNIDTLVYYFSFFLLGSCFSIFNAEDNIKMNWIKLIISIIVIIFVVLLFNFDISFYYKLYNSNYLLIIARIIMYICSIVITTSLYTLISSKRIKIITDIGEKSLCIYFFYSFITIVFTNIFHGNNLIILLGLIITVIICLIFRNKIINRWLSYFMSIFDIWYSWIVLLIIIIFTTGIYIIFSNNVEVKEEYQKYNIVSKDNINDIKNRSITIGFTGNMIMLEEQLKNSYNKDNYEFDYMFKYVNKYLSDIDYLIGSVEGISDNNQRYTLYNRLDINTKINVPSTLFKSLKDNNYSMINISNQRILDYGVDGVTSTIHNIEDNKLDYTGASDKRDNDNFKIVEVDGIKMGILSYTYAPVSIDENELFDDYSYVANFLCNEDSRRFSKVKDKVFNDFKELRDKGAELIIIMPNNSYGNSHTYDKNQKVWNEVFAEFGADVVLGNYSSSTQRIEYYGKTLVINSTGNFINNMNSEDSDLSVMAKVYIDKDRKDINGVSVIPIYSYKSSDSGYVPLPIYDALKDKDIYKMLSQTDVTRIKEGLSIIASTTLNVNLSSDVLEKEYFCFLDGYKRQEVEKLELTTEEENSQIYKIMKNSKKTCYIGDDYTAGNKNGGFGWFEPLVSTFDNEYVRISNSGLTSSDAANSYQDLINNSNCDLFVVAIGSNDVRNEYLNVDDYMNNIENLIKDIKKDVIMVAPWQPLEVEYSNINDYYHDIELFEVYNKRIKKYCDTNKCKYVNPNSYIKNAVDTGYVSDYFNNYYFPNSNKGIELFSRGMFH